MNKKKEITDFKLEELENYLTDIFKSQTKNNSEFIKDFNLYVTHDKEYFFGKWDKISTGIGGMLMIPREHIVNVIYNGIELNKEQTDLFFEKLKEKSK